MEEPFSQVGGEPEALTAQVRPRPKRRRKKRPQGVPRYHVVLWDSDRHTFGYVEQMLRALFGHPGPQCVLLANEVDTQGRAVVFTTTLEHAELKRDQIHAFGKDDYPDCQGSMLATIEPAA